MKLARDKTTEEICELLDVDESTVKRWVAQGCPCDQGGKRVPRKYNEGEVAKWMRDNKVTGKVGRPAGPLSEELAKARIRKENALARRYEIDIAVAEGKLLDKIDVERASIQKIIAIRNGLLSLPASLAPVLEGMNAAEIQGQIERAVIELLEQYSKG